MGGELGGSNPRPPACHAGALPAELQPHDRSTRRRSIGRHPGRHCPAARRVSSAPLRSPACTIPARCGRGEAVLLPRQRVRAEYTASRLPDSIAGKSGGPGASAENPAARAAGRSRRPRRAPGRPPRRE